MRCPASGCSRSKRSRIAASTGICRSAHAIRRTPSAASARSFTSYRSVGCHRSSLRSSGSGRVGREQALVLALLPLDPGRGDLFRVGHGRAREPRLDRRPKRGLAAETQRELELARARRRSARAARRARSAGSARGCRSGDSPSRSGPGRRALPAPGSGACAATSRNADSSRRSSSTACTAATLSESCQGYAQRGRHGEARASSGRSTSSSARTA